MRSLSNDFRKGSGQGGGASMNYSERSNDQGQRDGVIMSMIDELKEEINRFT